MDSEHTLTNKLDLLGTEVTAELLEKLLPPFIQSTVHRLCGISPLPRVFQRKEEDGS